MRDELVAARVVVPDERDIVDVHPEEVEPPGHRVPPEAVSDDDCVGGLDVGIDHGDGETADLAFARGTIPARHDAVDQDARVAREVPCLSRVQQHRQPQVALPEERLDRADPGRAVQADRPDQHDARLCDGAHPDSGQARLGGGELIPMHGPSVRSVLRSHRCLMMRRAARNVLRVTRSLQACWLVLRYRSGSAPSVPRSGATTSGGVDPGASSTAPVIRSERLAWLRTGCGAHGLRDQPIRPAIIGCDDFAPHRLGRRGTRQCDTADPWPDHHASRHRRRRRRPRTW